jgi:molybdopterin-guanine dinucleotide biosynthesis protein A
MKFTVIILAGGKSSRMGTDKGLVLMNEIPMIERVIKTVKKAGLSEIIIVSNNTEYKQFGLPVFPDVIPDKGPLGGIYTGLLKSSTVKNLILSCDVPFINETVLKLLIRNGLKSKVTIVKYENRIHNLIGIYDNSLIKDLGEHLISNKLKVGQFIEAHNPNVIDLKIFMPDLDEQILSNVNTMEELKKLEYGM